MHFRLLRSFEECERNKLKELNFVIIGAGPTGVELAGAFSEISFEIIKQEFNNFDPSNVKIYLIEGSQEVLPAYSGYLSKKAKEYIEQLGVIVLTGKRVEKIDQDGLKIGEKEIQSQNIIWAAGNRGSGLLDKLDVEQDQQGRIFVNEDLSLKGIDSIYVLGDAANSKDINGNPLPALAPVASQQGRHVARQLIKGKSTAFRYLDKGTMATIGNFKAVMDFRGIKIAGIFPWLSWSFVHILFLINFRNRAIVFMQWILAFIFRKKGARIITNENYQNNLHNI